MQHHSAATQHRIFPAACFKSFQCSTPSCSVQPQTSHLAPSLAPGVRQCRPQQRHVLRQPVTARSHLPAAAPFIGQHLQQHQRQPQQQPAFGQQQRRQRQPGEGPDGSQSASQASASLDSEEVAEEMLGSSQRKGAASISADAVLSRSNQDGADSADSRHSHACCQDHGHDHTPSIENPLHRVLLWIYSHTGAALQPPLGFDARCCVAVPAPHACLQKWPALLRDGVLRPSLAEGHRNACSKC